MYRHKSYSNLQVHEQFQCLFLYELNIHAEIQSTQKKKALTKPLFSTTLPTTSNTMPNANLFISILLLKIFESIHIKFPTN